jgi:CUB domain
LNGSSGTILSPNYPLAYSHNASCIWSIVSPAGTVITLNITAFNTENGADKLYIFLPQNCSSAIGKFLTGKLSPQVITIPQNQVSLYFVSNGNVSNPGFNITWSAPPTCVSVINSNICCPGQVNVNLYCFKLMKTQHQIETLVFPEFPTYNGRYLHIRLNSVCNFSHKQALFE